MASTLFVRETLGLSDAITQLLLRFARNGNLKTGDTLVIAAAAVTAPSGYTLDLRDPADPSYLLNLVLFADVLDAPGLTVNMNGVPGTKPSEPGAPARSARVIARDLRSPITVHADGGAGQPGPPGAPGADETFTIEFDPQGHPYREYEAPTPGGPGGNGGSGGNGGVARVLTSAGAQATVTAAGGSGGAAGPGGAGGKGAKTAQGAQRPNAPDGPSGQGGANGLAGVAQAEHVAVGEFWTKARAELGTDLAAGAQHWLQSAKYHYRQIPGLPTSAQADTVVGLLDLAAAADPAGTEPAALRQQFLNGDNLLGLPRNLDVIPDFERYLRRLDLYDDWIGRLFAQVNDLLAATSSTGLTEAQLQVQLNTLDFTATVLEAALADAQATLTAAIAEERGATARWDVQLELVNKRKTDLEQPVDWGGIVVVGLFAIVSFIADVYLGQTAGKLIGSIPDLMVLGNVNLSGSDKETKVLKDAISAGGDISKAAGGKDLAQHVDAVGKIDVKTWVDDVGPVLVSFAKFAKDMDAATGDAELKQLVKDLATRLQEKLAATSRREAARRQVELAQLRIQGIKQERDQYATLHSQARADVGLLRKTAVALLRVVRRYGDVFLEYQVQAARAVEIYTRKDESPALRLDRWHVHPDIELAYEQDLIDTVTYRSSLLTSSSELAVSQLVTTFDSYDMASFQRDVHYVSLKDAAHLDQLRNELWTWFTVEPGALAGDRWEAKVVAATVTLHGVSAATPTFALVLTHGPRCTDRLKDGTEVTMFLEPRETLVQIAPQGDAANGAAALVSQDRPTEFWRRSVATEWVLSIEPDVVADRAVDLSALSGIDVSLSYLAKRT